MPGQWATLSCLCTAVLCLRRALPLHHWLLLLLLRRLQHRHLVHACVERHCLLDHLLSVLLLWPLWLMVVLLVEHRSWPCRPLTSSA